MSDEDPWNLRRPDWSDPSRDHNDDTDGAWVGACFALVLIGALILLAIGVA